MEKRTGPIKYKKVGEAAKSDAPKKETVKNDTPFKEALKKVAPPKMVAAKKDAPYKKDGLRIDAPHKKQALEKDAPPKQAGIRLNQYIAHCGVCSRREADALIADGQIKVNKTIVTQMGYRVLPGDNVFMGKKLLKKEEYAYVLLNKPKDFITTTKDTHDRKTVMDLVKRASDVRLYPVGRLDRNTTGLLLLTNDGDLADRLSHPSNNIKKIYKAELNKPLQKQHYDEIVAGLTLDDGPIVVDELVILTADRMTIGIEIHSGRNRIVRRIFEHFEYEVSRLDRVVYAGLDKTNLPRGKWRHLTEREIGTLKKKGTKRV